jgi:hypothetical protein
MRGPVPGIHVFTVFAKKQDVDGRDRPGHDDFGSVAAAFATQCDRARQNATTCSSAVFIGEAGNSASASTAIAP